MTDEKDILEVEMDESMEDALMHYGTKRHSGRYPWGSGKDPYQHSGDFLARVESLEDQGLSEKDIAEQIGISTTELRLQKRLAKHERRQLLYDRARSLKEDGLNNTEIAEKMGLPGESSVRALFNEQTRENKNKALAVADVLKKEVEKKGMIDVGKGVERELGTSAQKLEEALRILEIEGYNTYQGRMPQATNPRHLTVVKVLTKPDVEYKDIYDWGNVQSVGDYHFDGDIVREVARPTAVARDRVQVRYGDEGGTDRDGLIEIRRGTKDLTLGNSHYAQVRIMMDNGMYMKGMAVYSDDLPDGVDIRFNSNKMSGSSDEKVFKKVKNDPDNPFGANIKAGGQTPYTDVDGTVKISPVNKLKEEGDYESMSKNLSQQFLSKQPQRMIDRQLKLTYADQEAEYDEICSLTNPTLKKKLLYDFADECDSSAVHLHAAALPRQTTRVILPVPSMKDNEVYAPTFNDGETVALIRYPHGGTFEIPVLTVNNKQAEAKKVVGPDAKDAIGIGHATAAQLSGADFDGDTVVVIPFSDKVTVTAKKPFRELQEFDPQTAYAYREGCKVMPESMKQREMGIASNLITDMTLRGADKEEIIRAVKHSMVVIDAVKHKLDYKQSEKDNGIQELKEKYQTHYMEDGTLKVGGASTLLSRRKQGVRVPERQGAAHIDKETGELIYKESGRKYPDPKTGKLIPAETEVSLMSVTTDARTLSTGTPQENAYADYANKVKALANRARKEYLATPRLQQNKEATLRYAEEVKSLGDKLETAILNAPRERRAQAIANSRIKAQIQDNPELKNDKKTLKKISQKAINDARVQVGASGKESRINITDREWEAIQAGAISDTKLSEILDHTDQDALRERALPKTTNELSSAKINKIKAMKNSGYTIAQIAEAVGVSTSTISKNLS